LDGTGKESDEQKVLINFAFVLDKHAACNIVTSQEVTPLLTALNADVGTTSATGHLA
jgi:hypothetical protein